MSSTALPAPLTATGCGASDGRDHASAFTVDLNLAHSPQIAGPLGTGALRLRAIVDGQAFYIRFPAALADSLPAHTSTAQEAAGTRSRSGDTFDTGSARWRRSSPSSARAGFKSWSLKDSQSWRVMG